MTVRTRIVGGVLAVGVTAAGLAGAAHADAATAPTGTAIAESTTAQPSTDAAAITAVAEAVPCDKHIAPNHAYRDSGFVYTTDGDGRPIGATGRVTHAHRPRTNCEKTVGQWGGPNYQGSHLIASTLNGISRRYNLVPATREVNQQLMKAFENAAKKCLDAGNVVIYTVAVGYTDPDVIPENFTMMMTIGVQQIHVSMSFKNKHYESRFISAKKRKLSNDLRRANCAG